MRHRLIISQMPELPEVEVVRRGLGPHVDDARIVELEVLNPRSVRQNFGDLTGQLRGSHIHHVSRRGKYLWFVLDQPEVLVAHLGMSGQFRVHDPRDHDSTQKPPKHLRITFELEDADQGKTQLQFIDQRTFGGVYLSPVEKLDCGEYIPRSIAHIARDPLDPKFDRDQLVQVLSRKQVAIKRVFLDQSVISGVGNIYADEALFRSGLHGSTLACDLDAYSIHLLVSHVTDVMNEALVQGGTSFDALYVNVNGESGYFSRSLDVYGRAGEPCTRCGTPIARIKFMNRSSYFCPKCQRSPSAVAHG